MTNDIQPREAGSIAIVTSIPPAADFSQRKDPNQQGRTQTQTLTSLSAAGFEVISVNYPGEIDGLKSCFPDVTFVACSRDGLFDDRYGPSFHAMFDVGQKFAFCGVINSDIYMIGSNILQAVKNSPDAFYVARRVDVDSLGGEIIGVYRRGIDFVLFDCNRFSPLFEDDGLGRFQLGAPFWDILLPIIASFHGEVRFISPPFILHATHAAAWSDEDYTSLRSAAVSTVIAHARKHAATRPRAASFLRLVGKHVGDADDFNQKRRIRKVSAVMNAWLLALERRHAFMLDLDLADPVFRASLKGFLAKANLGESIPDSPPKRGDLVSVGLRRVRLWQNRRRFRRLMQGLEP